VIAATVPWLLPLVGLVGLLMRHEPSLVAAVVAVLVVGPLLERVLPVENSRRIGGLTAVAVSLVLPLPLLDRLALVVATSSMQGLAASIHRPMVAGLALMVLAGPEKTDVRYVVLAVGYVVAAALWLFDRRHGRSGKPTTRQWFLFVAYMAAIGAVAAVSSWLLPLAQGRMVDWSIGTDVLKRAGFGVTTDLRGITAIQSSPAVTLRLWADGPRLLRGQVYSTYRDGTWSVLGSAPFTYVDAWPAETPLPAPATDTDVVERTSPTSRFIFMPRNGVVTAVPGCRLERNRHGILFSTTEPVADYAYRRHEPSTAATASSTPGDYLAVPAELRSSLAETARSWTAGSDSPRARVMAIANRLSTTHAYSLEPDTPAQGLDPILWFLTRKRAGHCELFATAQTLLTRSLGIPARYVTGYAVDERNRLTGYWVGRDSDAHAWCEVFLPDEGWVDIDATPGDWRGARTSDALRLLTGAFDGISFVTAALGRRLAASASSLFSRLTDDEARPWVLILAAVAGLAIALRRRGAWSVLLPNSWRPDVRRPVDGAARAWQRFEIIAERRGLRRTPATTAAEFGALVALVEPPSRAERIRAFIAAHGATRYGGAPWDDERTGRLLSELEEP